MIPLTRRAERQVERLQRHYLEHGRPGAVRNLLLAVRGAADRIERDPDAGIAAPRPYPELRSAGIAWVKAGRYWIAYLRRPALMISAVYFDTADIPGRF